MAIPRFLAATDSPDNSDSVDVSCWSQKAPSVARMTPITCAAVQGCKKCVRPSIGVVELVRWL
eukprot:SAG31_NODE_374_length_16577_cov_9.902173_7_plen_63_part_00